MDAKILMLGAAALGLAACQAADEGNQAAANNVNAGGVGSQKGERETKPTMLAVITDSTDLATLLRALRAAGLDQTLAGPGPYTLFAPVEGAFGKLPAGTVDAWMQPDRKAELTRTITHHLVPGVVTAADLRRAIDAGGGKTQLATIGGGNLTVTRDGDALLVNGAGGSKGRITAADLVHSNGTIHKIDGLLSPE